MKSLVCQVLLEEYVTFAVVLVNVRLMVLWDVTSRVLERLLSCIYRTDDNINNQLDATIMVY